MHSSGFMKAVNEAKSKIREVTIDDVSKKLKAGENFYLVDVREDEEWATSRIPGSIHLGKGIIEREIESAIPDKSAEIILYCGGGFRSALAAESIQRMGYKNVASMDGGIRGWRGQGLPEDR